MAKQQTKQNTQRKWEPDLIDRANALLYLLVAKDHINIVNHAGGYPGEGTIVCGHVIMVDGEHDKGPVLTVVKPDKVEEFWDDRTDVLLSVLHHADIHAADMDEVFGYLKNRVGGRRLGEIEEDLYSLQGS